MIEESLGSAFFVERGEMKGLTVGRMVHYVAYGTPGGEYQAGAHRAAIVAEVKDAGMGVCVLMVINPTGIHFNTASYSEWKPAEQPGQGIATIPGTWHWIEPA
mgnify:FL=1